MRAERAESTLSLGRNLYISQLFVRYADTYRSIEMAAMKKPRRRMTAMRHVGRSFAPVIKPKTADGRAPCSFPPRFSRRSREEKRGGNRRKHGRTTD